MGFQAAKLSDVYLCCSWLKYNIKTDINFYSARLYTIWRMNFLMFPYQLMPFIRENATTKKYFELHYSQDKYLYYPPFL
jgi:hypothetical protein